MRPAAKRCLSSSLSPVTRKAESVLVSSETLLWASYRSYASAAPTQAKVARFKEFGRAEKVLKIETEALPAVKSNDVLIKMLAAPIHSFDLGAIEGVYPSGTKPPGIPGSEGVGEVISVGSSVTGFSAGDWVVPAKFNFGTWRTHAVVSEKDVMKVRKNIKPEYASTLSVTPCTAYRLLNDFADLKEGDVVIQNGATGQVAQAVNQLAQQRKIKTINIIRDRAEWDDTVERMKSYGAYVVVSDEMVGNAEFRKLISDLPPPKLALNCVGGPTATEMARVLGKDGTLVTYGGISNKPVVLPTSLLIFKNIKVRGFWLARWLEEHSSEERTEMLNTLWDMVKAKTLRHWMERHEFESDFYGALKRAKEDQKDRKLLFVME